MAFDPSPSESSVARPSDIGEALREARERRGTTIDEAGQATFIPKRYLEALERDAPIDEYPAPTFARHFLREYAQFLGVDVSPLLERLGVPEPGSDLPHGEPIADVPPPRWRRPLATTVVVLVLAGGALAAYGLAGSRHPAAGTISPPPVAASPTAPVSSAPPSPSPAATVPAGVHLLLTFAGPCYVQATADGKIVEQATLAAGQTLRLKAKRTLQLLLGAPSNVRITADGKPISTGGITAGSTVTFTWTGKGIRLD